MSNATKVGEKIGRLIGSVVMTAFMAVLFGMTGMHNDFAIGLAAILVYLWNIENAIDRQTELLSVDYVSDDECT